MPCRVKNDFSLQFDIEVVYLSRGLNHAPVPETDVWMGQAGIYPGLPSYYLAVFPYDFSIKLVIFRSQLVDPEKAFQSRYFI